MSTTEEGAMSDNMVATVGLLWIRLSQAQRVNLHMSAINDTVVDDEDIASILSSADGRMHDETRRAVRTLANRDLAQAMAGWGGAA